MAQVWQFAAFFCSVFVVKLDFQALVTGGGVKALGKWLLSALFAPRPADTLSAGRPDLPEGAFHVSRGSRSFVG